MCTLLGSLDNFHLISKAVLGSPFKEQVISNAYEVLATEDNRVAIFSMAILRMGLDAGEPSVIARFHNFDSVSDPIVRGRLLMAR